MGGAGEVGRSGILLKGETNIMLDYGIKIDVKTEYPLKPKKVDACVISHAHLDHSGNAPALYRFGSPQTFATEPTFRLAELLIKDSIKLNKKKHESMKFGNKDLTMLMHRSRSLSYNEEVKFGNAAITLQDAGHICGSAITSVETGGMRIAYTGDLKVSPQLLHKGAEQVECDVLITESTYATRDHPGRENLISQFIDSVREVIDNRGIALVPVFAVGRAQEILTILGKHNLAEKVFLDGMAAKATEIVLEYPEYVSNYNLLKDSMNRATVIKKHEERSAALEGGNIIVTTAGMLNGGPVLNYITRLNERSMIFLTGYQAENTNGRRLLNDMPLIIDDQKRHIPTPFVFYDFSAHAGQEDLRRYVKGSGAETIICVHGDEESTLDFSNWLSGEGFTAYAPKIGDTIRLK